MGMKYRITYDAYPQYEKKRSYRKLTHYLFSFLVCGVLIVVLITSSNTGKLYESILPGDPAVTTEAFHQLSAAMESGETLTKALAIFCETIMDAR